MNIQDKMQEIHHKYGVTERANYEIQLFVDDLIKKDRAEQLRLHAVSKRTFRKAIATDVVVGAVVYLLGDDNDIYTITIDEVLRPDDQWKGFCGDDGCRYGLEGLYVC